MVRAMSIGRPSDYSAEAAADICARLAAGEPLVRICREDDKPHLSTVYRWLAAHEDFREIYARAREDQADTLADEIVEIADDGRNDTYTDGEGVERVNQDVINRSRLRVDARKWVAAKLKPRKYGDKVTTEHANADGKAFRVEGPWMLPTVAERNG
jgi:hypothetical protein